MTVMKALTNTGLLVAGAVIVAGTALGSRSSTDYEGIAETLDSGGGKSASNNAVNVGSLGGIAGVSTSTSSGLAKHGFVGQLYERVGLNVSAEKGSMDEESTQRLSAAVRLDDGTLLALAANDVSWVVVSSPLNVDTSGLVTALEVYRRTLVRVEGRLGDLEGFADFFIANSDPDNFGEFAGDGIDDALQIGVVAERPFVGIDLSARSGGGLYVELNSPEWELVYSETLEAGSWKLVEAGALFSAEGDGWSIVRSNLTGSVFLRARLK